MFIERYWQIFDKITTNNLLHYRPGLADDKIQCGFREQKPTEDAINKFSNDTKEEEENML